MTTGNDPALKPDDGQSAQQTENQQQTGAQPQANGQGPGLTFTDPQPEQDADEITLQQLEATAKAEEAGTANGQQQGTGDGKDPAHQAQTNGQQGQQQAPNGQQPAGDSGIMVPKARLDSVLSERDQLREQNAYLRGQTEALNRQPAQAGQQQQQPQPPTHEQRLAEIATKQDALAKRFDDGEITMADFKREERVLNTDEQAIREEVLAAKLRPAAPAQQQQGDPLYLDQLTSKLEIEHPWVTTFSQFADKSGSDAEWDYLAGLAKDNLKKAGVALNGSDVAKYQLRKEIAVLADQYGPSLLGERAKALGITIPGAQQAPNGQQQNNQLSPQAAARKAALEKAANQPPNLANLTGSQGDPAGQMSDERAEQLSEDDFDKLPDAVRNKLLGISGS